MLWEKANDNNLFNSTQIRGPGDTARKLNKEGARKSAFFIASNNSKGLNNPFLLPTL
jgi:hypothetical protein